jgi:acetyltransferase
MSTYRLKSLFAPRAIAVAGASPRELSLGRIVLENLRGAGFKGPIHLVNPRYPEIDGQATVPDIEALDPPPDLIVVTVPRPRSLT